MLRLYLSLSCLRVSKWSTADETVAKRPRRQEGVCATDLRRRRSKDKKAATAKFFSSFTTDTSRSTNINSLIDDDPPPLRPPSSLSLSSLNNHEHFASRTTISSAKSASGPPQSSTPLLSQRAVHTPVLSAFSHRSHAPEPSLLFFLNLVCPPLLPFVVHFFSPLHASVGRSSAPSSMSVTDTPSYSHCSLLSFLQQCSTNPSSSPPLPLPLSLLQS